MKLNNKGMAISGILYSILVLFIVLVFGILSLLASTKFSFDKFRSDIKEKLESTNFAYANEDYMLLSGAEAGDADQSIFKTLYPEKFEMIKSVNFIISSSIPENAIEVKDVSKTESGKVKSYLIEIPDEGYDLYVVSNSPIYANYDSNSLFMDLTKVTKYDFSNFYTDMVQNFNFLFKNNYSLKEIDVSQFNTSNVNLMDQTFYECSKLLSIDVSNWDISNVTSVSHMFFNCSTLTTIDLSKWDTKNLINTYSMFYYCINLETINLSNWDTNNVVRMNDMFRDCKKLVELDISHFNTSNVTYMSGMFYGCHSLKFLDLSKWDTTSLTGITYESGGTCLGMFSECYALEKILFGPKWNTSKITNMAKTFYDCNSLKSLDLQYWDTSNVTSMSRMFYNCNKLKSLDLSYFDTSKVTNMLQMFSSCKSLESLNLSNWNTSNVTTLESFFSDCILLNNIDINHFNTSKVTRMGYMFYNCISLTSLDLSNWDTGNVIDMSGMFNDLKRITEIKGLGNFNTSKVQSMYKMFDSCFMLKNYDLSKWDVSDVTNMSGLFSDDNNSGQMKIESIDISSWNLNNVSNYSNMFQNVNVENLSNITMKNTNYNSVNKLISQLPIVDSTINRNFNINGVNDLSQVNITDATSKNWTVIS